MEISWLGHSCIRVRSQNVTLIAEPYAASVGTSMGRQSAEVITVSHDHPHHSYAEGVQGSPRVLRGPGEYEIANLYINGLGTDRNLSPDEREINTVFCIHAEGMVLCHLGDLNGALSPRQIDELGAIDILFVPAGGVCTITPSSASELASLIAPRIVVPLHYTVDSISPGLQSLEAFLNGMGVTDPVRQTSLTVAPSSLPRDMKVVVLDRAR